MALLICAGILLACVIVGWFALRRPVRQIVEEVHVDRARELFHQQREWLEARFISALGHGDPVEAARWESAQWHDEVLWARDRQSRRLLALVRVDFELTPFDTSHGSRHATAIFEFRKGHWAVEGKRLDEMLPGEVVGRDQPYEAVTLSPPHPRGVG